MYPLDSLLALLFSKTILVWFMELNQDYFMATFFFISGIFTPKSYRKKGAARRGLPSSTRVEEHNSRRGDASRTPAA